MICIKIELWPFGYEKNLKRLGDITIWNNGIGNAEVGNYDYEIKTDNYEIKGEYEGFPRQNEDAVKLLYYILHQIYKGKVNKLSQPEHKKRRLVEILEGITKESIKLRELK